METKKYPGVDTNGDAGQGGSGMHDLSAPEALERIRSILFGEESRKNDLRFQQLTELIEKRLEDVHRDVDTRVVELARQVGENQNEAAKLIDAAAIKRVEAVERIEGLLADIDLRTSSRIDAAEARVNEVAEIGRRDLAETRDNLSAGVSYQIEQLKLFVDEAVSGLAHGKADKQALADWFEHLSARLRD